MLRQIQSLFITGLTTAVLLSTAFAANNLDKPVATIPGWPKYLAMGTVTNNDPSVGDALAQTPVNAIFKYAGNDGAGDRGLIRNPCDRSTTGTTLAQANYIEQNSASHQKVMPVMVVYTIDGSGGIYGAVADLKSTANSDDHFININLTDHYINLIKLTEYLQSKANSSDPHPATLIMNPDFLGAMQQAGPWGPLQPDTKVRVQAALKAALAYLHIQQNIPGRTILPNNVKGYVQSINWIIKTFSPSVPFGWQENLWSIGSANWIHQNYTDSELKTQITDPVIKFIQSIGVYSGPYKPNFLVFDRYERDDFYIEPTGEFFDHRDWNNYLTYVNNISRALNTPAMLWQIPGGHLITNNDTSTLTLDHVATAPDFFFGDANLNKDFPNNISPNVLNFKLLASAYDSNSTLTAGEYLQQDSDHNWNNPQLQNAVKNNIVAILWGGGSTTAVASISTNGSDGGWLANKVEQYYKHPVLLK